jgi:hypothetical protein
MAKPKDQRVEFVTDKDWLKRATAESDRLGMSLASFIRMSVIEMIERNERRRNDNGKNKD